MKLHLLILYRDIKLTGSSLMYHESREGGLERCTEHERCAVSPTWNCFLSTLMTGPSAGKSGMHKPLKIITPCNLSTYDGHVGSFGQGKEGWCYGYFTEVCPRKFCRNRLKHNPYVVWSCHLWEHAGLDNSFLYPYHTFIFIPFTGKTLTGGFSLGMKR